MAATEAAAGRLPLPAVQAFVAPAAWRAIDLISDLHLSESRPRAFDAWAQHLLRTSADAVFILGDLFDMWIGDDAAEQGFEARCAAVMAEAAARITVGFMAGNRDFLVGRALLANAGVVRLSDPTVVEAFGTRTLLTHGDLLCIGDVGYQRYRRVVSSSGLQYAFARLPLRARVAVGRLLRRNSRGQAMQGRPLDATLDVDVPAAAGWARAANASSLVHGHTHRPGSDAIGAGITRHVLSDWELDATATPRAEVLRWQVDGMHRLAPEAASR